VRLFEDKLLQKNNSRGEQRQMLTEAQVKGFAEDWLRAWNSHDLDAILAHYTPEVVLTSPTAARLVNDPSGTVRGVAALRQYFERGLTAYPNLRFELVDVMRGVSSVVLYYKNQNGSMTGEFMELDGDLKVTRVVANYSR
jgi:ketosteroid isomerase-like protein